MAEYHIRWDPTAKKWEVSVDGGAFADLVENPTVETIKGSSAVLTLDTNYLFLSSGSAYLPQISLTNTNADSSAGYLAFKKYSASPAINDNLGVISFIGRDSNLASKTFAILVGLSRVVTAGAEQGRLLFYIYKNGAAYSALDLYDDKVIIPVRLDAVVVGASIYNSGNIAANSGANTLMTFDSEHHDLYGFHDGGNTSRLTVPADLAGKYVFTASCRFEGPVTPVGYRIIRIEKNSAGTANANNLVKLIRLPPIVTTLEQTEFTIVTDEITMSAGDYCEIFVSHNQGAALNIQGGAWGATSGINGGLTFSCFRMST